MIRSSKSIATVAVIVGALFAPQARTQTSATWLADVSHVVIPQSRSVSMRSAAAIEVVAVDAHIAILERAATTTLQIGVRNPGGNPAEAVLLLPVPDGAVVSSFAFDGAAAEPVAELLPRAEARRVYDAIVAKARDPALLEFAGYNLIRSSVFPVAPGGETRVRLTYDHLLEGDGERVDYLLPRSESLRLRQPWQISVELKSRQAIAMLYSPSHDLAITRRSPNHLSATVKAPSTADPGAFRLSYLVENNGWSASLLAYPDPSIGGGYFLLMAGTPRIDAAAARLKREVTLVLDRSGSMAGEKLEQATAAARQVIEGLADGEAFNIVDYSTSVSMFAQVPVRKDRESIVAARRYLEQVRPTGGTNIHDALLEALRQPATADALPMVLFLTDGLPTIGKTSEVAIRELVERGNPHRRRVFTFGVGEDVNVPLLDRIADQTRAAATYILPREDVELKVAQVFRRLYGPVLADLELATLDEDGTPSTRRVAELIPARLPDLFDGDQLLLLGQYRGERPIGFVLGGDLLGEHRQFRFQFDLAAASTRNAFVARLWASRRIAFLVDQVRQRGAESMASPGLVGVPPIADARHQELLDEILRLSAEFGILTEYTAFLAREGTDLSDWQRLRAGCDLNLQQRAVATRAGKGAVNQGLNYNTQKDQSKLNYRNDYFDENLARVQISAVQQVCDRAFFQQDGRWIDSRLVADKAPLQPSRTIAFGSEEHSRLLLELITEGRQALLSLDGDIVLRCGAETVLIHNNQ